MTVQAGTAYVDVKGDLSSLTKQLGAAFSSTRFSKLGMAAGGALAAGVAVAGVGKVLYDIGKDFDDAYDRISLKTGATGKRLEGLKTDFKEVFKDVPADMETVSEAISGLNQRLDLTGKPLQKLTKQVVEFSRMTETDVGANVETTTRLFKDWSVATKDQSGTLDSLFRTTQASGIQLDKLAGYMVQFGSPLRQLGIDFEFASAMFATFEKEGVNMQTLMPGLRFALKNFSGASAETTAQMKKWGVSLKDPEVALQEVFQLLKDAPSDLKANAIAFEVFGTRAGPDMAAAVREGRFELEDLMKTVSDGDDTILNAADRTADFDEHLQKLKNTLKVELEPVAMRVFDEVGQAMKELSHIMGDESLSGEEKLKQIGDLISERVAEWAPKIAEAGGKLGIALMKGLADAFMNSSLLGKVFMAGAFIRLIGGSGVFGKIGMRIGGMIAAPMATTIATGAAAGQTAGTAAGSWKTAARNLGGMMSGPLGIALGIGAAVYFGTEFGKSDAVKSAFGVKKIDLTDRIEGLDFGSRDEIRTMVEAYQEAGQAIKKSQVQAWVAAGVVSRREGARMLDIMDKVKRQARETRETFARGQGLGIGNAIVEDRQVTKREIERIAQEISTLPPHAQRKAAIMALAVAKESRRAGDMGKAEFRQLRRSVEGEVGKITSTQLDEGVKMVRGMGAIYDSLQNVAHIGLSWLRKQTGNALEGLGANPLKWTIEHPKKAAGAVGGALNVLFGQEGGSIVPGYGTGDKVPLHLDGRLAGMVEPGELVSVTNRTATAAQMEWNKRVPRLQGGGLAFALGPYDIPPIAYDAAHASPNAHVHVTGTTTPWVVALGRQLQQMGFLVGEHPAFGGVAPPPAHSLTGGHYDALAIDVNSAAALNETRAEVASIARLLSGAGGGMGAMGAVAKLGRLLVEGPEGSLRDTAQGSLDKTLAAADAYLTKHAPREGMESFDVGNMSGSDVALMRRISSQRGWNFADWWEVDRRETGHGADLLNESSGAALRGQFMPGITQGHYGPGSDPGANPSMAQQIVSMAAYIAERYGNPTAARAHHDAHNWYKRGGIVPMLQGGGFPANQGPGASPALQWPYIGLHGQRPGATGVFTPTPPGGGGGGGGGDGGGDGGGAATFGGRGLGETFKHILGLGSADQRREALAHLVERIKKIVPRGVDASGLAGGLKKLRGDADLYADLADRASQLSTETADGTTVAGIVGEKTEIEWITAQLSELFQLRNRIIEAEKVVELRRDLVTRLLERTKAEITDTEGRLRILNRDGRTPNGWEGLNPAKDEVSKWNALGDPVRLQKMRRFLRQGGKLPGDRTFFEDGSIRTEDKAKQTDFLAALREQIVPAFTGQRSALNDARGTLLSELDSVQGMGAPMHKLPELPALGVLGGDIFNAQMRLRDLVPRDEIDDITSDIDDTGGSGEDDGLADLYRQQRDAAWADLNVMRAQQPTLAQFFAKAPFAGTFHEGGVVGGHGDKYARVKGGEGLFTEEQMAAMGGPVVLVTVEDGAVKPSAIRAEIVSWEHEKVRKLRSGPTVGRRLGAAT